MKILKRLFAAALAAALSVGAFAGGAAAAPAATGSITVENAAEGQTYSVYRLFQLDSYDAAAQAYIYKLNPAWSAFAAGEDAQAYISVDEQSIVTWVGETTEARTAAFARLALEYAKANTIAPDASAQAAAEGETVTARFRDLPLGYYLVESSLGALCLLTTTQPAATVNEKNGVPTVEKEVKDGQEWGKKNTANIGDRVEFRTVVTARPGAEDYVVHDVMSAGLTFDADSVTVTRGSNTLTAGRDYTLVVPGTETEGTCTFEVVFSQSLCRSLGDGEQVTVAYAAVVNDAAVVAGLGNPNDTWLDYGDDNRTATSTTRTYTLELPVLKYTLTDAGAQKPLPGAQFVLIRGEGENAMYVTADEDGTVTGWTALVWDSQEEGTKATVFVTPDSGKITISGLKAGTYALREVKAPDGYNPLKEDITVTVDAAYGEDGNAVCQVTYGGRTGTQVEVENHAGALLPTTGGAGTRALYAAGGVLVCGGALALSIRRRMKGAAE